MIGRRRIRGVLHFYPSAGDHIRLPGDLCACGQVVAEPVAIETTDSIRAHIGVDIIAGASSNEGNAKCRLIDCSRHQEFASSPASSCLKLLPARVGGIQFGLCLRHRLIRTDDGVR